jgi:hypothetical protein
MLSVLRDYPRGKMHVFASIGSAFAMLIVAGMATTVSAATFTQTNIANGHSYTLHTNDTSSFSQAAAVAASSGGYLVSITSVGEQSFVELLLSSSNAPTGSYFIGLQRPFTTWSSGEAVSYTNWDAGEPNNGGTGPFSGQETAVQILWSNPVNSSYAHYARRGDWNDAVAAGYHPYLDGQFIDLTGVGFIVEVVPEPTSMAFLSLGGGWLLSRRRGRL